MIPFATTPQTTGQAEQNRGETVLSERKDERGAMAWLLPFNTVALTR